MPDFRELTEFLKDTFVYIAIFLALVFVFVFIIAVVPVAGNSMNPTLSDGNMAVSIRCAYLLSSPERNDIITFLDSENKRYVKRVIGLPGESIDYLNGYLYIDGKSYTETFIDGSKTNNFMFVDICNKKDCPDGKIPEDHYLVLGDNRAESQDSRDPKVGLISKKDIDGKLVFRIWPVKNFGKLK